MNQTDWSRINVQQICEESDIARSTFYVHFNNKHELLNHCFSLLESELDSSLEDSTPFDFITPLMKHMKATRTNFIITPNTETAIVIFARFRRLIEKRTQRDLRTHPDEMSSLHATFISGGIFNTLEQWNRAGCQTPIKTVATELETLIQILISKQ